MESLRTRGIILRLHKLTETSLVVVWLTRDYGKLKTIAKGARRPKSPFRSRLDLFYHDELQFLRSAKSELHILQEVALIEAFPQIRTDLRTLQVATYLIVLCDAMTALENSVSELFNLLQDFLGELNRGWVSREMVLAFEFRLLRAVGLRPPLEKLALPRGTSLLLRHMLDDPLPRLAHLRISAAQQNHLDALSSQFFSPYLRRWPAAREAAIAAR